MDLPIYSPEILNPETLNQGKLFSSETLKGIPPVLLLQQVYNTIPFILALAPTEKEPHLLFLKNLIVDFPTSFDLDPTSYFHLCLAAHHATVASFVPTDVDIHIRYKLWKQVHDAKLRQQMAEIVLKSYFWDSHSVSHRIVFEPNSEQYLSGHQGEWFSTAIAAYAATKYSSPKLSKEIAYAIIQEIERETTFFSAILKTKKTIPILEAATTIAHNFGDLDRVIEVWKLPEEDFLKKNVFQLAHAPQKPWEILFLAGDINKKFMAVENHRHYALRSARCLRKHASLLLPIAPFLDTWGKKIATTSLLTIEEKGEIAACLILGWERLKKPDQISPIGYTRALRGIEENIPGGFQSFLQVLPRKVAQTWKKGELRKLCDLPQDRFEASIDKACMRHIKNFPN